MEDWLEYCKRNSYKRLHIRESTAGKIRIQARA